jgi:hypothetical protein
MKFSLIAAIMAVSLVGPASAKDRPDARPVQEQTCIGLGTRAAQVSYSSATTSSCCDHALACAQYLSNIVIPKPRTAYRT